MKKSMTRRLLGIVKYWEGLEETHEEYEFDIYRCQHIHILFDKPSQVRRELRRTFGGGRVVEDKE